MSKIQPDSIEMINEMIEMRDEVSVQDRDSYDLAYNSYMGLEEKELNNKQRAMRTIVFDDYVDKHPEVSEERLFTKAGGKDLRRDRLQTAKRVVKTRKAYIRATAPEVDLRGFDTARQKVSKEVKIRRTFTIPARVKKRIVFAMKTSVVVRGKSQVRFRNALGQFSSPKVK